MGTGGPGARPSTAVVPPAHAPHPKFRIRTMYGTTQNAKQTQLSRYNCPRLAAIKRKYVLSNLFRMNQNIEPLGSSA